MTMCPMSACHQAGKELGWGEPMLDVIRPKRSCPGCTFACLAMGPQARPFPSLSLGCLGTAGVISERRGGLPRSLSSDQLCGGPSALRALTQLWSHGRFPAKLPNPPPPRPPTSTPLTRSRPGCPPTGTTGWVWVTSVSSHVSTLGLDHLLVPSSDLD